MILTRHTKGILTVTYFTTKQI